MTDPDTLSSIRAADAARPHPFLSDCPPGVVWNGFRAGIVHGFDEQVDLHPVAEVTQVLVLFLGSWCGLNRLEG